MHSINHHHHSLGLHPALLIVECSSIKKFPNDHLWTKVIVSSSNTRELVIILFYFLYTYDLLIRITHRT